MKSSNTQIEQLKSLLNLEQKRIALEGELNSLTQKIDGLKRQLVGGSRGPAATPAASSGSAPKAIPSGSGRKAKSPKAGRGELKSRIFAALEEAGSAGVKVVELARSLGTNPANIYAWFHAAVKRYPQIKKVGSAEYRIGSGAAQSTSAAKPSASRSKPAPAPAAAPAAGKRGAKAGSKRGALQEKIINALKASGTRGITVKELAAKFRMPYRNVQVWFATTGKKHSGVRKIAPATYRYAG